MNAYRLLLYLRTLRHLRPRQAAYFVVRRLLPEGKSRFADEGVRVRGGVRLGAMLLPGSPILNEGEFRFLNESKSFDLKRMDWSAPGMSRLWRYNLQYFDYLQDQGRSSESLAKLISSWIEHHPPGSRDAWEPYTASLRVVNWIKYFLRTDFHGEIPEAWLQSLYQQACWLENNIEYHLLANHYLKNGKALFFAGLFFSGDDAERWLKLGLKILAQEAQEQILADGGHYERSPMYHSIVVEDYLDVLNLILSGDVQLESAVVALFKSKTAAALDFLHDMAMPDGEIPLFNDAAFGIAPHPEKLFDYARRVSAYARPSYDAGLAVCAKQASGYFVMRNGDNVLVVDCGPIGPDYQPGHAHCDMLSFELALSGCRVIVDSGVFDYANGPERRYARSTKAHNTVAVDGIEQSEIWGVFRVARRAYPVGASLQQSGESRARFEGAHDGYCRLSGSVIHQRSIEFDANEGYTVCDVLQGDGVHAMESYIHLHPDFSVRVKHNLIEVLAADGQAIAFIKVEGAIISLEQGWYFPEFGVRFENVLIVLSCTGALPLQLSYRISKI